MNFDLEPISSNPRAQRLVFTWDEQAGTVSGPGAQEVLRRAKDTEVRAHPIPNTYTIEANPLKSRRDMAAILGYDYKLPPGLAEFYPKMPDGSEESIDERLIVVH